MVKYHGSVPDVRLEMKARFKLRAKPKLSLGSEAWLAVHEYFSAQKPRFEEIAAGLGLTGMQAYALYLLEEPLPMGELAQRLNCDSSNVTGIVDRLEAHRLIERRPAPEDRRVKLLVLTAKGVRVREQGVRLFVEPAPGIASLSRAEQRTLRDLMWKALAVERGDREDRPARPAH